MILVVDASVAVKWFVQEDRSGDARALLTAGAELRAPRMILLEVAHVLWKAHRRGRLARAELTTADRVMQTMFGDGDDTDRLAGPAISLMRSVDLAVYDCVYLALAQRDDARLVTADERQFAAARKARIEARLL